MPGGLNAASIRQLDEIIECPICLDIYDDPRLLPCGHTYCLRCLQQFCSIDGDRRRRTMLGGCSRVSSCKPSCPICGKEFEVQSSDSSRRSLCDLPKNFSVQKLLLLVSQSTDGGDTQRRRTKACEECSVAADRTSVSGGGKQTASASFYCADCRRKLCRACCSIHGFNDRTAKHKTVPLLCSRLVGGDELDEPGGQRTCENDSTVDDPAKSTGTSQDPSECSLHCSQSSADASATIQLYCHDCRAALCIICFIEGGHSVHRCVHVKDAVGRLRSQLVADVDALDAAAASCHRAAEAVAADRDRFVVDVDGAVERIRQRAEELRQLIDRAADDLCRSLEMARKSKLDRSEQANGNITDRVNAIMTARADAETVLRNGVAGEIVKRADELHDEIGRRIREGIETIDRELGIVKSICVSFTESTMDRFDANKYIGEVDTANSFDDVQSPQPTLVQSLPNAGGGVYALALLGNQLFVVRHGARSIDVYDAASVPLTLSGCLPVPGLGPVSYGLAASSSADRCLYVSDYNANRVHRVELVVGGSEANVAQGNGSSSADVTTMAELRSWTVGTQPAGLSTTSTDGVLVTCYGAGELQEYRRDGRHRRSRGQSANMTLVRKVSLLPEVAYPWHAIRLSGNTDADVEGYVVTVSGTDHGVCLVGADGKVVRKFAGSGTGGGRRSMANSMKSPRCLASVAGGSLAVADQCNNRILLVDRSLTRACDLPIDSVGNSMAGVGVAGGSASLQLPGALCLDEVRGRLYIGEWIGGRVLVFDGVGDYINASFGALTDTRSER